MVGAALAVALGTIIGSYVFCFSLSLSDHEITAGKTPCTSFLRVALIEPSPPPPLPAELPPVEDIRCVALSPASVRLLNGFALSSSHP